MKDKRYSVALEYCGYAKRRWVVRFCEVWIGVALRGGKSAALEIARQHSMNRRVNDGTQAD